MTAYVQGIGQVHGARVGVALLLLGVVLGAPLSGHTQDAEHKVLRIGTSGDYAPFSMAYGARTGSAWQPQGLDIAIADAYARDRGLTIEWIQFRWPDLRSALANKRFDVAMSGITQRPERSLIGRYTVPVAITGAVALVRDGNRFPSIDSLDRKGVRIGVNRGGHLERVTRARFPRAEVIAVGKNDQVPALLFEGRANAVITDTLEAPHWQLGERGVKRRGPFSRDIKSYLVGLSRPGLAADLDRWLIENEQNGTLDRLRKTHLGRSQRPQPASPLVALLANIDERLALMPLVAWSKQAKKRAIEDRQREAVVIREATQKTQESAQRRGIASPSAEVLERFFRAQIEAAKAIQRVTLENPASKPATPLDLERDLRPALDRIGDRMARLLVLLPAGLDLEETRQQVQRALAFYPLGDKERDAIAESLVDLARSAGERPQEAVPSRVLSQ